MASWFFIGKPCVASVCKPSMAGVSKPPMASVHKLDIAISSGPSCRCCAWSQQNQKIKSKLHWQKKKIKKTHSWDCTSPSSLPGNQAKGQGSAKNFTQSFEQGAVAERLEYDHAKNICSQLSSTALLRSSMCGHPAPRKLKGRAGWAARMRPYFDWSPCGHSVSDSKTVDAGTPQLSIFADDGIIFHWTVRSWISFFIHETAPLLPASQEIRPRGKAQRKISRNLLNRVRLPRG